MWHVLHLIARLVVALLGLFCVSTAVLLYPTDEGKIQSRFEDLWIRVDDYKNLALSKHAVFMAQVAQLETRLFDKVFGQKLLSMQSVVVSTCCSFASAFTGVMVLMREAYGESLPPFGILDIKWLLIFLVAPLLVATAFIVIESQIGRWMLLLVVVGLYAVTALEMVNRSARTDSTSIAELEGAVAPLFAVMMGGFLCDIAFIALTRKIVQLAGQMVQPFKILGAVTLTVLLSLILISPYLFVIYRAPVPEDVPVESAVSNSLMIALSNIFDVMLSLLFAVLALLLLIHRLVWPLFARTLFKMADIGTKGRRAILTAIGLALLSASVFGGKFPELLKELVKVFGG